MTPAILLRCCLVFTLPFLLNVHFDSVALLKPAINYRFCRCYQGKINRLCHEIFENPGQGVIACFNDSGNNILPVSMTPAMIYHGCHLHW
jgi:hypothetical protein